jgi:hypothetical protein
VQCGPGGGNGGGATVTTLVAALPTAGCVGCPVVGGGNGTVATSGPRPTVTGVVTGGAGGVVVAGVWGIVGVVAVVGVLGL